MQQHTQQVEAACATEAAQYRAEMDKVTSENSRQQQQLAHELQRQQQQQRQQHHELQRQQQLAYELQQQLVAQTDKIRLADLEARKLAGEIHDSS